MVKPLRLVIKETVLRAIIENHYNVRAAAVALGISEPTMYRNLRHWNLQPPMWAATAGQGVKRKDFLERCEAIQKAFHEVAG